MWPIADLARKRLQLLLVEDVGDETHLAQDREVPVVGDGDPGRLLAAVLEREQRRSTRDATRPAPPSGSRRHRTSVGALPGAAEVVERHSQEGTPARLADPAERDAQLAATASISSTPIRRRTRRRADRRPRRRARPGRHGGRARRRSPRRSPPRRGRPRARPRPRRGRASPAERRARGTRRAATRPRGRAAAEFRSRSP